MSKFNEKMLRMRLAIRLPKIEYNQEGNYPFRNAEAMLGIIKPILAQENLTIKISDEVVAVGPFNYVKSTATIVDVETGETESAVGWGREGDNQPPLVPAMITGATSSYAHKYALQGLLAIDDGTMDPDAWNRTGMPVAGYSPQNYPQDYAPQAQNFAPANVQAQTPAQATTQAPATVQDEPAAYAASTGFEAPPEPAESVAVESPVRTKPVEEASAQEQVENTGSGKTRPTTYTSPDPAGFDFPMPDAMDSFYQSGPVVGAAPETPDFLSGDDGGASAPWEYDEQDEYPQSTEIPSPYAGTAPIDAPTGNPVQKRRVTVYGVSYDHAACASKVATSDGQFTYKAFDRDSSRGPWEIPDGTNPDEIDFEALYADASVKAGSNLDDYIGFVAP